MEKKDIKRINLKNSQTIEKIEELKKVLNIKTDTKLMDFIVDNLYTRLFKQSIQKVYKLLRKVYKRFALLKIKNILLVYLDRSNRQRVLLQAQNKYYFLTVYI